MAPPFIIVLLGLFAFIDVYSLGLGEEQRYAYVAVVLLSAAELVITRKRTAASPLDTRVCRVWMAAVVTGCVMVCAQPEPYVSYILGDAVSFGLPLLFIGYANRRPEVFTSSTSLIWLGSLLTIAMCGAVVFTDAATNRFAEPSILLLAICWVGATASRSPRGATISLAGAGLVLLMTLLSGARFALLLWLTLGAMPVVLGCATRAARRCLIAGAAIVLVAAVAGFAGPNLTESLSSLRVGATLERVASGDFFVAIIEDGSMNNRVLESDDALYTRWTQQGLSQWLFGSGHGATFKTGYAYYADRALDNGRVHHIHFGLVLLYYRYGVLGVLLFLLLAGSVARQLLALRKMPRDAALFQPSLVYTLAVFGYLLNLLLFNQLVDPIASFAFAGHLATRTPQARVSNYTRPRAQHIRSRYTASPAKALRPIHQ